jgi:transposase InsO family protein
MSSLPVLGLVFVAAWLLRGCLPGGLPELLREAHRWIHRHWWRWRSRRRGGRPLIDRALIDLIRRISRENPLWGAPRIHGELLKLGFRLSQSTVSKYMIPRRGRPSRHGGVPAWVDFLRDHAGDIVAIDMLTVDTLGLTRLYALVVLGLGRRRILHIEVAAHPTALWLARQITEAFPWDEVPPYLVRDNDGAYGMIFRRRLRAMGIRDRPTTPYSPWQNGNAERVIGSIRRECLDHMIIWNETHLRRVLRAYVDYYNNNRTHLGLGKDAPNSRVVEAEGRIVSRPVLGGLRRRYARVTRE